MPFDAVNCPEAVVVPLKPTGPEKLAASNAESPVTDIPLEAVNWPETVTTPSSAERWFVILRPFDAVNCPDTEVVLFNKTAPSKAACPEKLAASNSEFPVTDIPLEAVS